MRVRFKGNMANAPANRFGGLMTARGLIPVTVHRVRGSLNPDRRKHDDDEDFQYVPSPLHKSQHGLSHIVAVLSSVRRV